LRGIEQLAIGVLSTNPFPDATAGFFDAFQAAVEQGTGKRVRVLRPLADLTKCQVMELGRGLPLELTFSCIAPVAETHCGQCNKCAERQAAFRMARQPDPTSYVHMPSSLSPRQRLATSGGREE
jgi:7-cyano-7-deazaguanine synthase